MKKGISASEKSSVITVMILTFRTNSADPDQTAPIDQGLHCLLFHLHPFDEIPLSLAKFSGVRKFRNFTVHKNTITRGAMQF